jgi:hypothetical protein
VGGADSLECAYGVHAASDRQSINRERLSMWPFKPKAEPAPPAWEANFKANAPLVLASEQVMGPQRMPVCYAYRSAPNNPYDSGWLFLSGQESQAMLDALPPKICPMQLFIRDDETLLDVIRNEVGTAWERDSVGDAWRQAPYPHHDD